MIHVLAFAKLNLSFRVLYRRNDGFHEIESLIQTIDLADEIDIAEGNGRIEVANDLSLPLEQDLAWRAARAVLDRKKLHAGVKIAVRKRIPAGAGLGGGSSDAAATLWGVDRIIPPGLSNDSLHTLASELGSDVPLFLSGGLVHASGRGERTASAGQPRKEWFAVIVPPIHCDTARVYAAWDATARTYTSPDSAACAHDEMLILSLGENDLGPAACFVYPELADYRQAVSGIGAVYAGMSGSGSAFYAAFAEREEAAAAKVEMERRFPLAKAYLCRGTSKGFSAGEEA